MELKTLKTFDFKICAAQLSKFLIQLMNILDYRADYQRQESKFL